jgi:hypothetical protein
VSDDTTTVEVDMDELTLAELEDLEEFLGVPATKFGEASQGKLTRRLVYLMKRRTDPGFTYEQTGALTQSSLKLVSASDPR